jgi:predicted phage terminase large subunit-like protein
MDPIGFELSANPDIWTNVMLPMEYDPARKLISTIGWEDPRKEDGEILWPERFPPKEVANLKKALGVFGWSSQYNQNPIPREGGLVKRNWLKYYYTQFNKFQLVQFELLIGSWDLTFTDTGSSDCCGTVWGKRGTDKYLLACYKEKMDVVQQLAAIRKMKADFPGIRALLIEKKANGDAVIRMLQKEIPGLIAISPQEIGGGDKEVRLAACSIEYEAGNVYFPDKSFAPWVSEVISELINFPKASSDDFVDSSTQALNWLATKSGLASINVTATAEQLRHETGLGQDFDWIRRKTEKELQEKTSKIITEASSSNITQLKSIFS